MTIKIKQSHWALLFSFLSLFILGLADNIRGPLFPEILNQFQLSNTQGSWSFATTSAAAFVGSWISAPYLKKFSISSLLLLSVFLMGIGLMSMGKASSFLLLLIGSFVLGLSIGFMGVSQNLLVSENVDPSIRSRALSGLHGMYGLSSFFAPILASHATAIYGDWRGAFIVAGLISLLFFVFQFLIQPDRKFTVHQHLEAISTDQETVSKKASKFALLLIGGMFAFYVVAEILVSTRLALYMRTYFQMNLEQSSRYVTLFFLFLLIGRVLFAFIKLPISLKAQLNASLGIALVLILLGLKVHPFFLALAGLGMAPYYPLCVSYISEASGHKSRTFIAFAMSFQSLSVVSMHLGVGYLTDRMGLAFAFGVGILALVLSILCLNLHPRKLIVE